MLGAAKMHELRSAVFERQRTALLATRAPKARAGASEDGPSLAALPIARTETRRCNQRREDRHLNLADRAELRFRRRPHEVAVVNVSSHGAMIEAALEPRIGERLQISFDGCNRTDCTVRWIRAGRIGLEFEQETQIIAPAAVRELIVAGRREGETERLEPTGTGTQRPPRQSLFWKAVLHWDHGTLRVRVRNISAEGAMLEGEGELPVGAGVLLQLGEGPAISGAVRWARSGQLGIQFGSRFDMRRLARAPGPAQDRPPAVVKPRYLESELDPDSPWAAAWEKLTPGGLEDED
jgi:hypothetical protein